jgi:hypothetical protein
MPCKLKHKKFQICVEILLTLNILHGSSGLPLMEVWESFYSLNLACDFQNVILILLYLYSVTSKFRDFVVSDFQILELSGSPGSLVL